MEEAQEWWKPCIAEFVGTFALIFIGAGSVIISGGNIVAVALAHGLTIAVMVTALAHISGGHFNPAVTVAMLFTKKIQRELGLLYIIFQLLGSVFGAFLLVAAVPEQMWRSADLGTPMVNGVTAPNAVVLEAVMTFFLVFVIFGAAVDARNTLFKSVAGLAIGLTITADILIGGPLTGAALNPARAFGPALISREWAGQIIYWVGPLMGAIIAALVYDTAFLQRAKPKESPPEPPTPAPAEGQQV